MLGATRGGYLAAAGAFVRRPVVLVPLFAAMAFAAVYLAKTIPPAFIPHEDQGTIMVDGNLPEGCVRDLTMAAAKESVERMLGVEGVDSVLCTAGHSRIGGRGENQSSMTVTLRPWSERRRPDLEVQAVRARINETNATLPALVTRAFAPPAIPGFGAIGGVEPAIFSMGDNNVTYRFQLGSRVVDIPNESTAAGIVASTYGYNGGAHQKYSFEAPANMPNTFLFKNAKSGLYLQAVGKQVQQNRKVDRDESFMWKIEEAVLAPDTSKQDTTVAPKDTSDTNATDTSTIAIRRGLDARDLRVDGMPKRTFDLKGRNIGRQVLGRNRNTHTVLFGK